VFTKRRARAQPTAGQETLLSIDVPNEGEVTCICGRVWFLTRHQEIVPSRGYINCRCGRMLVSWNSERTWTAEPSRDLPRRTGEGRDRMR